MSKFLVGMIVAFAIGVVAFMPTPAPVKYSHVYPHVSAIHCTDGTEAFTVEAGPEGELYYGVENGIMTISHSNVGALVFSLTGGMSCAIERGGKVEVKND